MCKDSAMTSAHHVVVLLLPPVIGFDATIPPLVFGNARAASGEKLYRVSVCSADPGPAQCADGFAFACGAGLEALETADTVVVPGTLRRSVRRDGVLDPAARAAFERIPDAARVVSLCTGAFGLAAAGLLDGLRATTHWQAAAQFRRLYPLVQLDEAALFFDEGRVLTSAGLSAGLDLCLHVVGADAGWRVANKVARHCVTPPHRDGDQSQFISWPSPPRGAAGTTATQHWALGRLDQRLTVGQLAGHARMSPRTFARRFTEETGLSPARWLARERVRRCQELLESTDLTVDTIAQRVGFGTGATLRARLRAEAGTTPSDYRRRFTST
ncbi:Putative transcriptional regulator, AraC-family [Corynebacterium glyciniphilum AJ 3170]|uniref:Putative transcriptional regulator, AraC-family n=2 Tax=Corynebacterium TaxID=1716 RepID=X5DP22_9CORY|nr:Putative transcriptional regulator, AraC-family [Corynebacterium glyciniphilum AJ 3170]